MTWKFTDSDIAMLRKMAARERRLNPPLKGSTQKPGKVLGSSTAIKFGKAAADIVPDTETGSVIVWDSSVTPPVVSDPVEQLDDVILDWITDQTISEGKEVAIIKVDGLDRWRILWAECESPPAVQIEA